jgi:hypothetical protein
METAINIVGSILIYIASALVVGWWLKIVLFAAGINV